MGEVHLASPLRPFSCEEIDLSDQYGWVEGTVSDFQVKTHAYAVDDYCDWYFDRSPFGGRIAHPDILAQDILGLYRLTYDVPSHGIGGFHTRNEVEFLKPVFVGQNVVIRGRNTGKYQKRRQNFWVREGEALDESGEVLIRLRATETVGVTRGNPSGVSVGGGQAATSTESRAKDTQSARIVTAELPDGAPIVDRADKHLPTGAGLHAIVKHATIEQSIAFSGFRYDWVTEGRGSLHRNIHTDEDEARHRGLPKIVLQGLISSSYISELCTGFFGPSWITGGRISVAFIRPVFIGDTVTVSGMVKQQLEEQGRIRLDLDVWCRNQRGELVTVGYASAPVD